MFGLSALEGKLIGYGLAFLVLAGLLTGVVLHLEHVGAAKANAELATQRAQWQAETAAQAKKNADDYARRLQSQSEAVHDATIQADAARADAARNRRANDTLRMRLNAYTRAAHARGNPASSAGGTAAPDSLDVLAELLSRASQRAGQLAAYADAARIAGQTCERSSDALKDGSQP